MKERRSQDKVEYDLQRAEPFFRLSYDSRRKMSKARAAIDIWKNPDELGERGALCSGQSLLGSILGTDHAVLLINLVFGPSQKRR